MKSIMADFFKRNSIANVIIFIIALIFILIGVVLSLWGGKTNSKDIQLYNRAIEIYEEQDYVMATSTAPASYPLENLSEAISNFQQAASITEDNKLKSLALYNIGTAIGWDFIIFSEDRSDEFGLEMAISLLREAVWLDPENEDAKYNLEYLEYYASFYGIS